VQGNTFIQKKTTPGFAAPTSGIIQPSNKFYVIPSSTIDQYGFPSMNVDVFDNPVIKYKKLIENGTLKDYKLEEIIHIKDVQANFSGRDYYYGTSRLYSAVNDSNTLKFISETINTILNGKGALGFISQRMLNGDGQLMSALNPNLIKEVEQKVNEGFGTTNNRHSIMVTGSDMRWNRMDSPINEFLPVELSAMEFDNLCNQMGGVPSILFNAKTNASYNNMREAKASFYTNCLAPIMGSILSSISKDLKITYANEWLEADFDDIEELQQDRKQNADAKVSEFNYLGAMLEKKLISKNDVLEKMDFPKNTDPSFNEIEKPEPVQPIQSVTPIVDDQNSDEDGNDN
jgi:hypothetical protein